MGTQGGIIGIKHGYAKDYFVGIEEYLQDSKDYQNISWGLTGSYRRNEDMVNDLDLLKNGVEFNDRFFPRVWAHYELEKVGTIRLMRTAHFEQSLRSDSAAMKNMIFGNYLVFDEILDTLKNLENEINSLG